VRLGHSLGGRDGSGSGLEPPRLPLRSVAQRPRSPQCLVVPDIHPYPRRADLRTIVGPKGGFSRAPVNVWIVHFKPLETDQDGARTAGDEKERHDFPVRLAADGRLHFGNDEVGVGEGGASDAADGELELLGDGQEGESVCARGGFVRDCEGTAAGVKESGEGGSAGGVGEGNNGEGDVLLANEGSRGRTMPSSPAGRGEKAERRKYGLGDVMVDGMRRLGSRTTILLSEVFNVASNATKQLS
jgi:hypothetical protein